MPTPNNSEQLAKSADGFDALAEQVSETFGTGEETKAAIHELIQAEDCRGLRFSVEAAD